MKKITLTGSQRVAEFKKLIESALEQGSFVSRHLKGDAVDIAPLVQEHIHGTVLYVSLIMPTVM
ncbi:hypothetical protein AGMMS49944_02130 [Spirochaetia bacterium]|nr:hypothetical protein AGMMS49944_02130 [Spirochaetia bacterium]